MFCVCHGCKPGPGRGATSDVRRTSARTCSVIGCQPLAPQLFQREKGPLRPLLRLRLNTSGWTERSGSATSKSLPKAWCNTSSGCTRRRRAASASTAALTSSTLGFKLRRKGAQARLNMQCDPRRVVAAGEVTDDGTKRQNDDPFLAPVIYVLDQKHGTMLRQPNPGCNHGANINITERAA